MHLVVTPPPLHVASWRGNGPPLLLLHGMAAHSHWWDMTAPRLTQRLQPAALDLSGHGDSDWREDGVYDAARWVSDVEKARQLLGWERFALCGHSLGARVAIDYALAHPSRLSALIAVDFLAETSGSRFSRPRPHSQPYYDDPESAARRFRLMPQGTALGESALANLARQSIKKDENGFTWKYDWRCFQYAYTPLWPALPQIRTRTLIVHGELSALMDKETLARVAAAVPGAEAATVSGAYHHVPLDAPARLSEVLLDFLSR